MRLDSLSLDADGMGESGDDIRVVHSPDMVSLTVGGRVCNYNSLCALQARNVKQDIFHHVIQQLVVPLCLTTYATIEEEEQAWEGATFALFFMHTFVDAKLYQFHHREFFPVLLLPSSVVVDRAWTRMDPDIPLTTSVLRCIRSHAFAMAQCSSKRVWRPFIAGIGHRDAVGEEDEDVTYAPLSPRELRRMTNEYALCVVCFIDFSSTPTSMCWPVRNMLLCLRMAMACLKSVHLLALRGGDNFLLARCRCRELPSELIESIDILRTTLMSRCPESSRMCDRKEQEALLETHLSLLRPVGVRNKSIEVVDLARLLDPRRRAETDSRMNLELMRWRMLPALDLGGLASCRALLLGVGTLGCHVARNLLMWGVRHLTLVDRGRVSYSNLARQSLFTFEDAKAGRSKVDAAADAVRAIIPDTDVRVADLTIPMPGHPITAEEHARAVCATETLVKLITSHDVVFLLTDSREARWVPSVIASAHGVGVINVALGFDTYVVMRHGTVPSSSSASSSSSCAHLQDPHTVCAGDKSTYARALSSNQLACYFCSDIVGPMDSMTMRTLDQQCTVTRPAVASIASAIAVEVLAGIYQQSRRFSCAGYREQQGEGQEGISILGVLPQQIRGSVYSHTMSHLHGDRNPFCTACSENIVKAYCSDGVAFILRCINEPEYIEEMCGVKALKRQWESEGASVEWDFDSDAEGDSCPAC